MAARHVDGGLAAVLEEVRGLQDALVSAKLLWATQIERVDQENSASAVNLAQYWAVRQRDLRSLQRRLARFGLSSLGRSEPHVQASLDAIAIAAMALIEHNHHDGNVVTPPIGFTEGTRLLRQRTTELLGPEPDRRQTRIMVTLPTEAAGDQRLVQTLVDHGMDLARINCAHDDPGAWAAMVSHVRYASAASGRECRVAMDLAGPKLRTGPLVTGSRVVKLRPVRDALGRVTAPAWCWLTSVENPSPPPQPGLPVLPVPPAWLARLQPTDTISLRDTRDAQRRLGVAAVDPCGALASTERTVYLATGTVLHANGGRDAPVGTLPPLQQFLTLHRGDTLVLTRDCRPAPVPPEGPPRIGCTLPEVFDHIRVGHHVHLDDGKISGIVVEADHEQITLRITFAGNAGTRLRATKGINLPDTTVPISALTATDRANLRFVTEHADLVEMSFVRGPQDIDDLLSALDELGDTRLGIIIKIETAQAFQNLPEILMAMMRRPRTGVMIARGDLAVECGYERLAELQEEILWLCEAAHLPVIWATQVLDQLARSGQPSRAEITDAAVGVRAECVMLNKGPHIVDAVVALDDILRRMTAHHYKKNALMRPLRSWLRTARGERCEEQDAAQTVTAR
jgi:pyruvate kinase